MIYKIKPGRKFKPQAKTSTPNIFAKLLGGIPSTIISAVLFFIIPSAAFSTPYIIFAKPSPSYNLINCELTERPGERFFFYIMDLEIGPAKIVERELVENRKDPVESINSNGPFYANSDSQVLENILRTLNSSKGAPTTKQDGLHLKGNDMDCIFTEVILYRKTNYKFGSVTYEDVCYVPDKTFKYNSPLRCEIKAVP